MLDSVSKIVQGARILAALAVAVLAVRAQPSLEIALLGGWTSVLVGRGTARLGLATLMIWPAVYLLFWRHVPGRYSRAS